MLLEQQKNIENIIEMNMDNLNGDDYRVINNWKMQVVFQIECHSNTIKNIMNDINKVLPWKTEAKLTFEDFAFEITIVEDC